MMLNCPFSERGTQERKRRTRLPVASVLLATSLLAGCHRDSDAPFPTWIPPQTAASDSAFAELQRLGVEVELSTRGVQPKASPSGKETRELDARLGPSLAKCESLINLPTANGYVATASLKPDAARIGWDFLGHALERRLGLQIAHRDYDGAVKTYLTGTRFALLIASGDASDVLVGLPIADTLRRQITPVMRDFSPLKLHEISSSVTKDLVDIPPLTTVVTNERASMYAALQAIQDLYRDGHANDLEKLYGKTVHDSVDTLVGYRGSAETKRVLFFNNLANGIEEESKWLTDCANTPASTWKPEPMPKLSSKQPWNALARQFVLAGQPMLNSYELTLARSRLLAITAELLSQAKATGAAPANLKAFPKSLNTDPYTGRSFFYVTEGLDFHLYSAGADGTDNEGETDDSGTQPDLVLEGFG